MGSAATLLALGLKWYRRGGFEEARALFEAAREHAVLVGEIEVEADAWSHLGRSSSLSCEPKIAEHAFAEAGRCFRAFGDHDGERSAILRQAFVAYDAGDLARSSELLDRVESDADASPSSRGVARGYRGNLARGRGELDAAQVHYQAAVEALSAAGTVLYAATFEMDLAVVALLHWDGGAALGALTRARAQARRASPEPMLEALMMHYEVLALASLGEVEETRRALGEYRAPASAAMSYLSLTHRFVEKVLKTTQRPDASLDTRFAELRTRAPTYEHARLTLRILRRMIGGTTALQDRLRIDEATRRAQLGDDIDTRFPEGSAEWGIFLALVDHRQQDGSAALSAEALIEAGWPGARLTPASARNRLHVALSGLRKRGLRDVLLRHPEGYALSRLVIVVRSAQSESA